MRRATRRERRAAKTAGRLIFAALALVAALAARAEEPAKRSWKDSAELRFTDTTGNSRVRTFGASNLFSCDWERTGLELKAGALTATDRGRTDAEEYNASEKVRQKVAGKLYAYEKFGWDRNRFDGILERYDSSLGVGDELLSAAHDKIIAEAGAGLISEERTDKTNDFASGRLYGKYTRTLSKTSNFSQDAEYLHDFMDAKDYRFNAETALTASVADHAALKGSYKWKRAGKPVPGFGKDDTITGITLIINY